MYATVNVITYLGKSITKGRQNKHLTSLFHQCKMNA